jgi:hypothetical protein
MAILFIVAMKRALLAAAVRFAPGRRHLTPVMPQRRYVRHKFIAIVRGAQGSLFGLAGRPVEN